MFVWVFIGIVFNYNEVILSYVVALKNILVNILVSTHQGRGLIIMLWALGNTRV